MINLQWIIYTWHFCPRIQVADPEYKKAFDDELVAFKKRIRKRAEEKIAEYEREERLGPGGLDPLEVMESLPKVHIYHVHLPAIFVAFLFWAITIWSLDDGKPLRWKLFSINRLFCYL